ncbi:MAG: hypothetical protein JW806_03365 [Sedimentisphaerales bacterium]|nr:hypothetical protein [Sedimentisphaerales bacterium]
MATSKLNGISAAASILTGIIWITAISVSDILSGSVNGTIEDAALTSGLAVIGNIVGGGVMAGVVIAAMPLLFSIAGLGLYKLYKA